MPLAALLLAFSVLTASAAPPCALNGALQPDGSCACFGPWRGADCSQLALGAVPAASGYGLAPPLRSSWGGNVLPDAAGTFHLFVAEMALNCSLAAWERNSLITHATAAAPEGPYLRQGTAVGVWGHNPQVLRLRDGSYALFHIGTGEGGSPENCTWPGTAAPSAPAPPPGGATVHVAASLNGPWTPFPGVPPCNNPAPLLHPNGTLYLACNSKSLLSAPALQGPWTTVPSPTFVNRSSGAPVGAYEDCFLWIDPRGAWHALFHVYQEVVEPSCANSNVSAHAFSQDGLEWHFSPVQPYTTRVELEDGTSFITPTRERPKLLFGADGEPTHLLNGAVRDMESCPPHWCSHCKMESQHTFTLVTPLLAAGAPPAPSAQPPPLQSFAALPQAVTSCWRDALPRTPHGFPSITPQQCADAGSCFDSTYPDRPWCFFPNATPTSWAAPGPVQRYAGSQAAPALASRVGSVHAAESGDVAGVSCLNAPPLAQSCDSLSGAASPVLAWPSHLAVLGSTPLSGLTFQWTPAELRRWASVGAGSPGGGAGCTVATALRLSSRTPLLLLLSINVTGCAPAAAINITLSLPAHISAMPGVWAWGRPAPPPNPAAYAVSLAPAPAAAGGLAALSQDATAASASAAWAPGALSVHFDLAPDLGATLAMAWPSGVPAAAAGLVLAAAPRGDAAGAPAPAAAVLAAAEAAAADFPAAFAQAQGDAEALWAAAFTPGNALFSGALPVLPASSTLARPYYAGVMSLLMLLRNTSSGTAAAAAGGAAWALPTAAPVWAVTDTYLWDSSMVASVMALLEPVGWRTGTLVPLLSLNTHEHYARDYVSGTGVGPWYSFNDVSLFNLLDRYGRATARAAGLGRGVENLAWYNSTQAGKRVVEYMDEAAVFWQSLVAPNASLADYGLAYNLLECVPTYLHAVPSLNAANVYMMRRVAEVWGALGNASRAAALQASAAALLPHVLALYNGDGTWNCQYPSAALVNVRTVIDLVYTADALAPDLTAAQRADMASFLRSELLVPGWLRALSLRDAAASASDRADHGPLGSYDGWPPMAARALAQLGYAEEATALLAEFAGAGQGSVLSESCFGQAHRVLVSNFSSGEGTRVIKQGLAGGQDFFESVGGAFAEVALQLMGMV